MEQAIFPVSFMSQQEPTPAHTGPSLVSISATLCKPCCSLTRDHLWELRLNEIITLTIRLTFQTLCSPSINGSSGCILDLADCHLEEFSLHCEALSDHFFSHLCSCSQNNARLIGIQLICPLFFLLRGSGTQRSSRLSMLVKRIQLFDFILTLGFLSLLVVTW